MTHVPIETRHFEGGRLVLAAAPFGVNLLQAEQIEVADREGTRQYYNPPNPKQRGQKSSARSVIHRPHEARNGTPLTIEQDENDARREDVGATLQSLRHESRPPSLESRPCH